MMVGFRNAATVVVLSVACISLGTVAGYAVVQAANSSSNTPKTMALIAGNHAVNVVTGIEPVANAATPTVSPEPAIETAAPAMTVTPTPVPVSSTKPPVTVTAEPHPSDASPTSSPTPSASTAVPKPTVEPSPTVVYVSSDQASTLVTEAAYGTVLSSTEDTVNGKKVWVVTLERPDKSVIAGIVDASTGVVTGWAVIKEAPPSVTATPIPTVAPSPESSEQAANSASPDDSEHAEDDSVDEPSSAPSGNDGDHDKDDD